MKASPYGALLTDLYQLTMLQAYFDSGMEELASFEFFVRKLPPHRGFLMAAGLEQAIEYLEGLRFASRDLQWLQSTGRFKKEFIEYLEGFSFTGAVDAMPEGTVFFPDEPILRVTAPIMQAQFVESRIINILHYQTLVASKAARVAMAAPGKLLVDFGLRRAHAGEAGLFAARASYIAGFTGTSTVLGEQIYGIPSYGTMAHSFIQAHDNEEDSFVTFARSLRDNVVFLLDTYDTEAAAHKALDVARRLEGEGIKVAGVRLDSGDLAYHARKVRKILDDGSLKDTSIFVSGNLDECAVDQLMRAGAPIDGFGVGTKMDTSSDASYLDCAYKLVAYGGRPRRKRSEDKATWPGAKQVFRIVDDDQLARDILTTASDEQEGTVLIHPVMRDGKRIVVLPSLDDARRHAARELSRLPDGIRAFEPTSAYRVDVSEALRSLAAEVDVV